MERRRVLVRRVSAGSLLRIVVASYVTGFGVVALLVGVMVAAGMGSVRIGSQYMTGFQGLFAAIIWGWPVTVIALVLTWPVMVLGSWLYSLLNWPYPIEYIEADDREGR